MAKMSKILAAASALLVSTSGLSAQTPTPRPLDPPQAELSEPLSSIAGLRELSNGRVIIVDSRERAVWLTDPGLRQATKVGREGQGPQEYARPNALMALPGDTTWVADPGNNRNLVLGPTAAIVGTQSQITIRPSEGVTYTSTARGVDRQGRLYFTLPLGLIDRGPNDKGDTPILRYDRTANRFDTVATFNDPARLNAGSPRRVGGTGGVSFGTSGGNGFAGRDEWAVSPDGAIAVVRWKPYRVEWRLPNGSTITGPEIAYTPVRVGDAEKREYLDALRARGSGSMTTTGADGKSQTVRLPVPEPESWAEFKPPFATGGVVTAPDQTVWIQRSLTAAATDAVWDVVDRTGRVVRQVLLPKQSRVLGFGANSVYIARIDKDDLLYVRRHAMPR
jgi:hypothetical protein